MSDTRGVGLGFERGQSDSSIKSLFFGGMSADIIVYPKDISTKQYLHGCDQLAIG